MRRSADRFLSVGIALCALAMSAAFAGPAQAQVRGQAPGGQQPGQDLMPQMPMDQPAPAPAVLDIPKPFHGSMSFEAGSGRILTLTLPAANIYVADPKVAEVRPASSTSLFVFGVGAGQTTIAAVDMLGRLLADYQITVRPSGFGAREAQGAIARLVPGSQVQVRPQGKGLLLTGGVANAADAAQAVTIAKGFATGENTSISNQMSISAPTQVTLMVKIAEMKRSVSRSLGLNWSSVASLGKLAGGLPIVNALLNDASCAGVATGGLLPPGFRGPCFNALLTALAKDGLAHILAEPNLTVMSGQTATFQSGGEYPYAVAGGGTNPNSVTIEFKPYGVLLSFVPTVLSDGRINLHVKPEVSQLDSTNTTTLPGGGVVNGLLVRRAETTVELGSGETFAIAGMLQTSSNNNNSGLPGLGDTPIIGGLFKNNAMTREETELVIVITPILVRPVQNVAQLRIPGDGYQVPGDFDRLVLGRQVPNRDGSVTPRGPAAAGFIVR
ncbi:MAG: type II and III secretion system protein family protein [Acetobacteraceae bacterium]|nr:type II and III secretion system protein family protein [Acetobacteraceae bacterium]